MNKRKRTDMTTILLTLTVTTLALLAGAYFYIGISIIKEDNETHDNNEN